MCDIWYFRYKLIKKFCDALWKPTPNNYICVRAKERFLLTPDIHKRLLISQRRALKLPIAFELASNPLEYDTWNESDEDHSPTQKTREPTYSAFNSVMFIRSIAKPWARHISRKTKEFYVYNINTKQTEYEVRDKVNNRPSEAEASFSRGFKDRVTWSWPQDSHGTLTMESLVQMLNPPKTA